MGPNYNRPTAPTTPEFKEAAGWQPAQPSDQQLRGHWWQVYQDPELYALEDKVSVSNQSLKVTISEYTQAHAMVQYQRANYFPFLSAGAGVTRLRESENRATYFNGITISTMTFPSLSMSPGSRMSGVVSVVPCRQPARMLRQAPVTSSTFS